MKLSDQIRIEAPREQVYAALNDPEILAKSIPGCEKIEQISETELVATVVTKVGPIKAKFKGQVTLSDLNPPESYTISGEGKGGPAGFAKGGAKVSLEDDGGATILRYEVQADVGGKLAQLGGRLIEGTAKKLAGEFFARFSEAVVGPVDEAPEAAKAPVPAGAVKEAGIEAVNPLVLIVCGAFSLVVLYLLIG